MRSERVAQLVLKRGRRGRLEQRTRIFECRFSRGSVRARAGATRAASSSGIEGYGAVFNSETVIYRLFRERILPGAFKDSIAQDDIRVAFNHSPNYIIGRTSAGTATLSEDGHGLKYAAEPPDATWAADLRVSIARGDISGSSFQFEIERDEDEEWDFSQAKQGKLPLRTIKRARVLETGPVAWPAYENTTVSTRGTSADDIETMDRELRRFELEHFLEYGVDLGRSRRATTRPVRRYRAPAPSMEPDVAMADLQLQRLELGL